MKTTLFGLIGVLVLVAAFTPQQYQYERGADSCFDVFDHKNVPAVYDTAKFKQCYRTSWWHPFNIKRVDEIKQAIKFWTPERVTYARLIKNKGGSYGGASSAEQQDTSISVISIDPVSIEPSLVSNTADTIQNQQTI